MDPYVGRVLSEEPVDVQRTILAILSMLKSIAKTEYPDFRQYARSKYPALDEDVITIIEDILEHPPKGSTRL